MYRPKTEVEVLDTIDAWHEGDSELPLHEFLGWTKEEYKVWAETNVIPDEVQEV